MRRNDAVIDGAIACLAPDGRSVFKPLMFRRDWPYFLSFDLLSLDGRDLRLLPLIERKRLLKRIMPHVTSRVRYVDHISERGIDFRVVCRRDLEGIVAKWRHGTYQFGHGSSWLKIKNPFYSQMEGSPRTV